MSDVKLGELINSAQARDAIHVAVAPVFAAARLAPGQHVGILSDGNIGPSPNPVGIVDPFLKGMVEPGQRCWLLLYQNTVTGMRHEWRHPAFETDVQPTVPINEKQHSEIWLRAYAMRLNRYDTPEEGYERLLNGLKTGELHACGSNLHGRADLEDEDKLKLHAERLLGIKIDFGSMEYSCSC